VCTDPQGFRLGHGVLAGRVREPVSKLVLSNSTIKKYKTCKRSWYLTYYRQLGTPKRRHNPCTVAELGTRVHTVLEAYYGYGVAPADALDVIYDAAETAYPDYADQLGEEKTLAEIMVNGYLEWVAENGIDEAFEVVSTEQTVSTEMEIAGGHTVTLMGKLDQQVRRRIDDALMFRDFKTVGTFSKADDLVRDEQFRFYAMLWSLTAPEGERVAGGLYTMLRRSKQTERSKGPYYQQIAVSYNRHDLNSMWLRTRETASEIDRLSRRLDNGENHLSVAYPNPSMTCSWMCPFVSVCHLADDGSRFEDALSNLYEKKDPYAYYGTEGIDLIKSEMGITEEASAQ
jgi:RecB family exonuclease